MRNTRRRSKYQGDDMMALPEESTIKAMTKGDDCVPVTMHDIFAHRKEAQLTSKVMGKEVDFDMCFDKLLRDVNSVRDSYYRAKDIRNGWELPLDEFMDLTAYYKSFFNGCTRDSMRLLLLQTRRNICNLETTDPNRFKKRKYKSEGRSINGQGQLFKCETVERVTPLSMNLYTNFFEYLAHKRVGIVANTTYSMYINKDRSYTSEFIAPFVAHNGIRFQYKDADIDVKNWFKVATGKEIQTPSKLDELATSEKLLAGNQPLRTLRRRR